MRRIPSSNVGLPRMRPQRGSMAADLVSSLALLRADAGTLERMLREAAERAGLSEIEHGFQEGRFTHGVATALGVGALSDELARAQAALGEGEGKPGSNFEAYLNRRLQDLTEMIRSLVRGALKVAREDDAAAADLGEASYLSQRTGTAPVPRDSWKTPVPAGTFASWRDRVTRRGRRRVSRRSSPSSMMTRRSGSRRAA